MTTEEPTLIVLQHRRMITDSGSYVEYRFSDRPEEVSTDVEELCRSRGFDPLEVVPSRGNSRNERPMKPEAQRIAIVPKPSSEP